MIAILWCYNIILLKKSPVNCEDKPVIIVGMMTNYPIMYQEDKRER